jgi:hypothetical protein
MNYYEIMARIDSANRQDSVEEAQKSLLDQKIEKIQTKVVDKAQKLGLGLGLDTVTYNSPIIGTTSGNAWYDADSPYNNSILPDNTQNTMRLGNIDSSKNMYVNTPEKKFKDREATPEEKAAYFASMVAKDNFAMGTTPATKEQFQDLIQNPLTPENEALYTSAMNEAYATTGNTIDLRGVKGNLDMHGRQVVQAYNPTAPDPTESLQDRLLKTGNAQMFSNGVPIQEDVVNAKEPVNNSARIDEILNADKTGLGNAVAGFGYMLGEGIANTLDLVPEVAQYAYGNLVGDGKTWSDSKGLYDEKESKQFKEWTGYNDEILNTLGQEAVVAAKDAVENGNYWGLAEIVGKAVMTPELAGASLGFVAGMALPGTAGKRVVDVATGVNKAAKAMVAADTTGKLTKAEAMVKAGNEAGTGYKIASVLAGNTGYVAGAEGFARDAEALYQETYNEEMPTAQRIALRPIGLLWAKMDAGIAKALVLGKDPVAKAVPELIKVLPDQMKATLIGKVAVMSGVTATRAAGAFGLEALTEGVQTAMEQVAGKYKEGTTSIGDALEDSKYDIAGGALLGGAGGTQFAAPSIVADVAKGVKEAVQGSVRPDTETVSDEQVYEPAYTNEPTTRAAELRTKMAEATTETRDAVENEVQAYREELINNIKALNSIEEKTGKDIANTLIHRDALTDLTDDEELKARAVSQKNRYLTSVIEVLKEEDNKRIKNELLDLLENSGVSEADKKRLSTELVADQVSRILGSTQVDVDKLNALLNSAPKPKINIGGEDTAAPTDTGVKINPNVRPSISMEGIKEIVKLADEVEADRAEVQAQTEQTKEKADNTSTETHTVGLSSRTINKLAQLIGAKPEDLAKALGSAVRDMRIKNMKSVGKEANKIQYEMYHGKRGIMPTFTKLRKAIETGSNEEVDTHSKELIRRSIDLQTRLSKYELAYNEMYDSLRTDAETLLNDGDPVSDLLDLSVEDIAPGDIGKITDSGTYKIASDDVLKDVLVDLVQEGKISKEDAEANKIDTKYKSNPISIMEAQEEARLHIEEMFDSVGIVAPTINTRVVSAEEDITALNEELTELSAKLANAKVEGQKTKINKQIAKVNAELEKTKTRGKRLAVDVENKSIDLEEFMESSAGLKLGEVLEKGTNYVKPEAPVKTGVMAKVAKSVEDAQSGKYESEVPQANIVTEVEKVLDTAKVQEAVEEVKSLEAKKAKIEQIAKPRVEAVTAAINERIEELEGGVKTTLGEGYKIYNTTKEELTKLYEEIKALKGEKAKNTNLVRAIEQIRKGEGDIDAAKNEIEEILASKEQNKEKGILNALIRMYVKTKVIARLADRVLKWIGKTPVKEGTRFDKLIKEVDAENAKIDKLIAAKQEAIKTEEEILVYEVGTVRLDEVKRLNGMIRELKKRRRNAISRGTGRVKEINTKIREIKSKLMNTKLVDDMGANSSAKAATTGIEEQLKNAGIDPKDQPLNPWSLMSVRSTVLGALGIQSLVTILGDTNGARFDKFRNATKIALENKLDTDVKKGLDWKLFNDPAFAVAINGKGELNDTFVNAVAMVSVDYVANGLTKLEYKSDSDLARMLGIAEYELTAKMKKTFRKAGSFKKVITYSLGRAVASNMGLSPSKNMSEEHWNKLVQGLGQMALLSMEGRYVQNLDNTTMAAETYAAAMADKMTDADKDNGLPIPMVKSIKQSDENMKEIRELAKAMNTDLDVFGVTENYHTAKPSKLDTKTYKVRGGLNEVPESSQVVMRKLEANEMTLNEAGMKQLMLMADTKEKMLDMLKDYKRPEDLEKAAKVDKTITKDAYDSAISRNRELESAVDELLALKEKRDNGSILNKLYFRWFFSKNGRFFIDSAGINPQTEKLLHRWLITSKDQEKVWDMKDPQDEMYFKISVVQAFDGSKVKKTGTEEIMSYGAGIDKVNLEDVSKAYDKIMRLSDTQLTVVGSTAAHPGHAALAIAGIKAMRASKNGKFTGTMLIEYDAVTSGFILKLLQTPILSGEGKLAEWIAKGGIFEGSDKRIEGKGTADVIGGSELAVDTKVDGKIVPKGTKVVGIVDAYKSQGHTMQAMAKRGSTVMDIVDNNIVFKAGTVKVKEDTVNIDKKGLVGAIQKDGLIEEIFEVKDGNMVMEYSYDAKGNLKVGPKLTKFGRDLFKPGFMTFNYGSSLKSIKRMVGEVLAEKIMDKLMEGKVDSKELDAKLKSAGVPEAKVLVKEYAVDSTKQTKIGANLVQARNNKTMALQDVLEYILAESYGEAITGAMENEFGELMTLNESIINSTKVMFRLWKTEFDKLVDAEPGLITKARKKAIFDSLAKKFPLIKAPFTDGELDKVAISTDELTSYDSRRIGNTQTAVKNREFKTMTVQLMTRQLAEAHAAGAVLPIHWIDGTIMAKVLGKYAGVLGVHDALVLGKLFGETVQEMNKATLEIGRDYDMVGAIMESLLDAVEDVSLDTLTTEMLGKGETAISYAEVIAGMKEQYNKVQEARKEFYSTDKIGGNIAGHKGTTYRMEATKKEDTGILGIISGKTVEDINNQLNKLIKECM